MTSCSVFPSKRTPAETELLIDAAYNFYKSQLKGTPEAIRFMKGRCITGATPVKYGIGFAPDGWQNLKPVMGESYETGAMLQTGLAICYESGRTYDRLRNRLSAAGRGRFKRQEMSTVHHTGGIEKQKIALLGKLEELAVDYE